MFTGSSLIFGFPIEYVPPLALDEEEDELV